MIVNYINGNISTARRQAKRFTMSAISDELQTGWGFEPRKAWLVANYLKTGEGWQEACDA